MSLLLEVQDLRMQNLTKAVESLMVFVAAIFANAFLPQLIIKYMYTQEELLTLTETPQILEVLPTATFTLAAVYFLYVVYASITNSRRISVLKKEMKMLGDTCCGGACGCGHDGEEELTEEELKELESIVEEALKPKKAKSSSKKKTAKKASKK